MLKATKTTAATDLVNFKTLYKQLKINKSEQALVTDCLMLGLARFHDHVSGSSGRRAIEKLAGRIGEPYIFGFGAVEVARNPGLALDTRLKFIEHALHSFDATTEYGIPHGLPILASCAASTGALQPDLFRPMLIAAGFAGAMFDDWQIAEVQALFQWLIDRADMPKAERLWWLWQIMINCEEGRLGRRLGGWLLAHDDIGLKSKKTLCTAWLTDTAPGEPPPQWEALQALLRGDVKDFVAHAAEAGVTADATISGEEIEADYDAALDALLDDTEESRTSLPMPLQLLRNTLVGPLGDVVYTPSTLKHLALITLPNLGDDPVKVCQTYLGEERRPQGATLNLGVAAIIRAHQSRIPKAVQRKLVARGLKLGGVATRKTFYQLGADLFGENFWKGARQDEAKSIRDWVLKKSKATQLARRTSLKSGGKHGK